MKRGIWLAAAAVMWAVVGCADAPTGPRDKVILTAAQAAVLMSRAQLIASAHSDLAWLADSMEAVLKAGTEARLITLTRDGIPRTFYAVGLARQYAGANPFSTFHLIGFDVADNPTSFILANGYAPGTDSTPPSSVVGTFGGSSVFAHIVHISGLDVKDLVAVTGDAAFVLGDLGAGCAGGMFVTCNAASLVADFRIDIARPDINPTDTHSVSQTHVVVPGVVLAFSQAPPPRP